MEEREALRQLGDNLARIRDRMARAAQQAGREPRDIRLCAVCKGRESALIRLFAGFDVDCFGENRAQELARHLADEAYLSKPCHFIGHLQTNKLKAVVGRVSLIQSVDSLRLLQGIAREAARQGIRQDILIQLNIGDEASKTGAPKEALFPLLDAAAAEPGLRLRGLMAIPPSFDNGPESRRYFAQMYDLQQQAAEHIDMPLDILSLGMSDSFEAAILEGANLVRIGRSLFEGAGL